MTDLFYTAFEDKYRGSRELIKARLKVYLSFIQPLLQFYPKAALVDLGCGRGEWLELTSEHGFHPQGVDIDGGMLQRSRELGLNVRNLDALVFLKQLPDNSQAVVSGFHIAEHIAFDQLQKLVQEAKRVLAPGGLLILETPNPENLIVGTSSFYLDPTHQRPIPPDLLHFLPEHYGYYRQKIMRLQEPPHLISNACISLMDVMCGVSPDFSVIAQKAAAPEVLQAFDAPFSQDYGLTLHALAERFQKYVTSQLEIAESAAKNQLQQALLVAQTAQQQMQQALARAEQAETLTSAQRLDTQNKEAELAAMQQELHNVHQANHNHWLQLEQTRKELHEIHQSNHRHWHAAEQRQQQINALYNSKSWRITAPLRWPSQQWRLLRQQGLKARAKALVKKILRKALTFILNRPLLKFWGTRLAYRLDVAERLKPLVRSLAQSQPAAPSGALVNRNHETQPVDLARLSSRARQIYDDLKAAIAKQYEGGR